MFLNMIYGEAWKWGGAPKELVIWSPDEPILRMVSKPALSFDKELKVLLADMSKTMGDSGGVGISAIQIGVPYRVMCVRKKLDVLYIINPEVLSVSEEKVGMKEGCLSIPGVNVNVFRPKECVVQFQNVEGDLIKMELTGTTARIFLHELDHLDGKIMLDRVNRLTYSTALKKLKKRIK